MLIFLDNKFSTEITSLDFDNKIIEDFLEEIIIKSKGHNLVTSLSQKEYEFKFISKQDPIIRFLSDNCKSIIYESSIEKVINEKSTIHKLLLVDKVIQNINSNSVEYFNVENIEKKWIQYSTLRDDYILPTTKEGGLDSDEKFDCWSTLKRWKHPISEIYIYDKYLLVDTKHQSIKNNLIPMLSNLSEFSDNEIKIKIFTLKDTLCLDNKNQSSTYPFDAKTHEKIKYIFNLFEKEFDKINLSISLYEKSKDFVWLQHDRILLTNYYLIDRGAGFNIFDANNNIKDHSEMNFKYIFHKRNFPSFSTRKKDIQKLINLADSNSPSFTTFFLNK